MRRSLYSYKKKNMAKETLSGTLTIAKYYMTYTIVQDRNGGFFVEAAWKQNDEIFRTTVVTSINAVLAWIRKTEKEY